MWGILQKRGFRRDALWTNALVYKSVLARIPLFLDTQALMQSQYAERALLQYFTRLRLEALFTEALRIPFWRDVFERAGVTAKTPVTEALSRLSVISKKDLSSCALEYVANTDIFSKSDPDHTSGSTGRPLHFYFDWHASLRSFAVTERIFRVAGKGVRYPIVYMRARERNGFTFVMHTWFFLRGHHGVQYRIHDLQKLAATHSRGFILYGYTSSVLEVARQMEKRALSLPLKAVMTAGEHLTQADREYLKKIMNTEVFTLYASREAGYLGFECPEHRMHVNEEWAYLEIVDDAGTALPDGKEGRVVVTTFDNQVMPFIRYDLGDRGILHNDPCPCGRTLKTITFRGRVAEVVTLADDRRVSLLDISATVDWHWNTVRQFQLIQKSPLEFVLKVVPGPLYESGREALQAELVRLLHPRVSIEWQTVDILPEAVSGKAIYFIREMQEVPA